MKIAKLPLRMVVCTSVALLATACTTTVRYHRGNRQFQEWNEYQGKGFAPSGGRVVAVDPAASTITINTGKATRVLKVTSETRLIHEDTDITLAQFPLNQSVKIVMSEDDKRLMSVWYGHRSFAFRRPGSQASKAAKSINSL